MKRACFSTSAAPRIRTELKCSLHSCLHIIFLKAVLNGDRLGELPFEIHSRSLTAVSHPLYPPSKTSSVSSSFCISTQFFISFHQNTLFPEMRSICFFLPLLNFPLFKEMCNVHVCNPKSSRNFG